MTQSADIRERIRQALAETRDEPRFADAALRVVNALGYESDLTPPASQSDNPAFWTSKTADAKAKRDFLASADSMRVCFR